MAQAPIGYKHGTIWEGGHGMIQMRTVARDEGEAIANLIEREPLLNAIGCFVAPMADVDGCRIVALLPPTFVFGDARRLKKEAK